MKHFLAIILILTFAGCRGIKHIITAEGQERPVHFSSFTYRKKAVKLSNNASIDTQAVYRYTWSDHSTVPETKNYEFLRFFDDGHVLYLLSTADKPAPDFNNLKKGTIGYYLLDGDKVRIELFEITYGVHGSMRKTFGYIKDSQLVTYQESPETFNSSYKLIRAFSKNNVLYWEKMQPAGLLPVKPDW